MRYHLGAGISHHYPQMLLRLDLVEYSGLDMRGVGGVFHRGRSGKLCSVCIVLVCTTNVNLIWPRDRPFLCCVHPKSIGLDDAPTGRIRIPAHPLAKRVRMLHRTYKELEMGDKLHILP